MCEQLYRVHKQLYRVCEQLYRIALYFTRIGVSTLYVAKETFGETAVPYIKKLYNIKERVKP